MSKRKPQDDKQSERFIETARELGCDESEEAFGEKLRRIAKVRKGTSPKAGAPVAKSK